MVSIAEAKADAEPRALKHWHFDRYVLFSALYSFSIISIHGSERKR